MRPSLGPIHGTDRYAAKWFVAGGVTLVSVMELIDTSIINVAIPEMCAALGASLDEITWVSVSYILAAITAIPMAGWLSSTLGRRNYFLYSIIVFTASSFFCGLSSSLASLVFWRVVQGAGGGAFLSISQAILQDAFPPEEKAHATAIYGIGMMCGPALGPTLGGTIVNHWSWPWIFHVNIPLGLIAFGVISRFLKEFQRDEKGPALDFVGLGLMAVGLSSLLFVLERGEHHDWFQSPLILGLSVLSAFCLTVMVWWELKQSAPFLNLRVLKDTGLRNSVLFAFVLGLVVFSNLFISPLFIQTILGYDPETTGWIAFPGAVASAVTMMILAKRCAHVESRILIGMGAALMVLAMFMHSRFTERMDPMDLLLPTLLRGTATGLMFLPLGTKALQNLKGRDLTEGSALFTLSRQVGGSIGIAVATTWISRNTAVYRGYLGDRISDLDPTTRDWLDAVAKGLRSVGMDSTSTMNQAIGYLDLAVQKKAALLSFNSIFTWIGWILILAFPLIALIGQSNPLAEKREAAFNAETMPGIDPA